MKRSRAKLTTVRRDEYDALGKRLELVLKPIDVDEAARVRKAAHKGSIALAAEIVRRVGSLERTEAQKLTAQACCLQGLIELVHAGTAGSGRLRKEVDEALFQNFVNLFDCLTPTGIRALIREVLNCNRPITTRHVDWALNYALNLGDEPLVREIAQHGVDCSHPFVLRMSLDTALLFGRARKLADAFPTMVAATRLERELAAERPLRRTAGIDVSPIEAGL